MQSKIKVVFIDDQDVVQEIETIDPADYDVNNGVHRREMGVRLATQVENIWKRQALLFAEAAGLVDRPRGECPRNTPGCIYSDCSTAAGKSCFGPDAPKHVDMFQPEELGPHGEMPDS